jgi:hypothetical protein
VAPTRMIVGNTARRLGSPPLTGARNRTHQGTLVTSYYDWSAAEQAWKDAGIFLVIPEEAPRATLGTLAPIVSPGRPRRQARSGFARPHAHAPMHERPLGAAASQQGAYLAPRPSETRRNRAPKRREPSIRKHRVSYPQRGVIRFSE